MHQAHVRDEGRGGLALLAILALVGATGATVLGQTSEAQSAKPGQVRAMAR